MTDIATLSADVSTASALVTPFGAHLLSWRPTGHPDVLWLSSRAVLDGTKAIRGGIPLCLPWFGSPTDSPTRPGQGAGAHGFARTSRLPWFGSPTDSPTRPGQGAGAHGFARTSPWTLLGSTQPANDAPASFSFELHHTGETSALYPHSFCARLDITAGAELNVTLTLTNEDDHPFAIEAALHTYLHVGDVKDVTLEGLDGERYYDKVRERYATQTGDVTFIGPTDRVYTSTQQVQVVDPKLGRRIIVDKNGSGSTIVWNPWSQGAATMSDIGEGEWQNFVCVETAAVRERALTLWPGHPHIMTQTLAVETLD